MRRLAIVCDTDRGVRVVEDDVRCDRCAHWVHRGEPAPDKSGWCNGLPQAPDMGPTPGPTWIFGSMGTAPDFGCALWEAKQ